MIINVYVILVILTVSLKIINVVVKPINNVENYKTISVFAILIFKKLVYHKNIFVYVIKDYNIYKIVKLV